MGVDLDADEYTAALHEQWPHETREKEPCLCLPCQWKIRVEGGDEQDKDFNPCRIAVGIQRCPLKGE